jgi:HSP20 family protein
MFSKSTKINIKGFEDLEDLEEIFNTLSEFQSIINNNGKGLFSPSVKIQESKESFIITVAAPGQSKDIFDISVEKGVITIKAEVKEKNDFLESFSKSYRLPSNADVDSINADYKDGILKITISKKGEQTSKKVNIS